MVSGKNARLASDLVSRYSKVPLHQQLYSLLREKIRSGEWAEGILIPAEPELIAQYGVSRIVIRQVFDRLVNEGLIIRQRGRGSFVAERRLEEGLERILSFTEDMHQRGLVPSTQVLSSRLETATAYVAERLGIEPGEELAYLERLRLANDEPMSIEGSLLLHRYFPGLLDHDFSRIPLRETLLQEYGVRITRAHQVIRAVQAQPDQARLLTAQAKAPLLMIERISFSEHGLPIEFIRILYRGDRYSLYNDLHD